MLLQAALDERPDLLLLDEPTSDLDGAGTRWLVQQLARWRDGLVVVSHDRQLLRTFTRFFIVAESGCRYLEGTFGQLLTDLTREREDSELAHRGEMNRLLAREEHNAAVRRRRQRKKNLGRIRELKRCPARIKLNDKRSYKQESQGKRAVLQKERIGAVRDAARASRRALPVALPLEVALPRLPEGAATPVVRCDAVTAMAAGRILFRALSLEIARERIAVCGANGSGKTTLLEIALGLRTPAAGQSRCQSSRIGYIAQNADNWRLDESLAELVALQHATGSAETIVAVMRAHRFPLALARRSLASLSPGERLRAALILPHPALAAARAAGARRADAASGLRRHRRPRGRPLGVAGRFAGREPRRRAPRRHWRRAPDSSSGKPIRPSPRFAEAIRVASTVPIPDDDDYDPKKRVALEAFEGAPELNEPNPRVDQKMTTTVREARADERGVIAQRAAARRSVVASTSGGGDVRWLGPIFAVAAAGAMFWMVRIPSFPAGMAVVTMVAFSVIGFWGARAAAARKAKALADIDSVEAALARAVTEYRIETIRIVVVSERDGDDETFWFFRDATDRTWLGVEDGQWIDLDVGSRAWNRDVRIAVDSERRVVSIVSTGAPVPVEHRELQPPDYETAPNTIFWTRPDSVGPAPFVTRDDPTIPPGA